MDLAYTTEQDMLAESIQRHAKTWLTQTWATARCTGKHLLS